MRRRTPDNLFQRYLFFGGQIHLSPVHYGKQAKNSVSVLGALLAAFLGIAPANVFANNLAFIELHKPTLLDGASSIAISPDNRHLYMTNADEDSLVAFSRDAATGMLSFLQTKWYGTANTQGLDRPLSVAVSPDGYHVYTASLDDDTLSLFTRDTTTGTLTYTANYTDGLNGIDGLNGVTSITLSPVGEHAYATGSYDDSVVVFSRDMIAGELSLVEIEKDGVNGVDGLNGAYSVSVSPDGYHVYVVGQVDDALAVFSRDTASGELTFIEILKDGIANVDGLDGAYAVSVSPAGDHVYVAGNSDDAVAVFSRDSSTGKLSFVEAEKDGLDGVDGLNGAYTVTVSLDGGHVYVGSDVDDSLVVFRRDVSTGEVSFIEMLKDGSDGIDGLDGASSLAFDSQGDHLYVSARSDNAITAFSRDIATGNLNPIKTLNENVDGMQSLDGSTALALGPDGMHVYVASDVSHSLSVFRRDTEMGVLSLVEVHQDADGNVDGLLGATSVSVSPDGANVYVAGRLEDKVAVFDRDVMTGQLEFVSVVQDDTGLVDGLDEASSLVVSPDGQHVYVTGSRDNAVAVFTREANTGELTFVEMQADGINGVDGIDGASSLSVSPDGAHVYIAGRDEDAVAVFSRNAETGVLSFIDIVQDGVGGIDGLDGLTSVTVSPDGSQVYSVSNLDNAVTVFDRDGDMGALAFVEMVKDGIDGVDGLTLASSVRVSPDGEQLYATGEIDDAIAVFDRNSVTGELTFIEILKNKVDGINGLDAASAVAVSPDGANVYATGHTDDAVVVFERVGASALPGTFELLSPRYEINEAGGEVQIRVIRTIGRSGVVTIDYTTSNDTALAGEDYVHTAGSVIFADGDSLPRTIIVPITLDGATEPDEQFNFSLSNPSGGASLGSRDTATVTIVNADSQVTLSQSRIEFVQAIGITSLATTVNLTNTGRGPLVTGVLTVDGEQATNFSIGDDTCSSSSLAADGTCSFDVTFTAHALGGHWAQISIPSNATASPNVVALIGIGYQDDAVLNVPGEYQTVADAVIAASTGDTIFIAAGDYEAPGIVIDKHIQLIGAGAGETSMNGTVELRTSGNLHNLSISPPYGFRGPCSDDAVSVQGENLLVDLSGSILSGSKGCQGSDGIDAGVGWKGGSGMSAQGSSIVIQGGDLRGGEGGNGGFGVETPSTGGLGGDGISVQGAFPTLLSGIFQAGIGGSGGCTMSICGPVGNPGWSIFHHDDLNDPPGPFNQCRSAVSGAFSGAYVSCAPYILNAELNACRAPDTFLAVEPVLPLGDAVIASIVADLGSFGLERQSLQDDGTNGDLVAGDGIYSHQFSHSANSETYTVGFTVQDSNGRIGTPGLRLDSAVCGASIAVNPTSGLVTTEDGGTAEFTVALQSQPTGDVTIGLSSSDPGEGTASPEILVFTSSNWDQAQTVTVIGMNDDELDGDQLYRIETAAAISSDPSYNGLDAADVSITNQNVGASTYKISATAGAHGAISPSGSITVSHGEYQIFIIAPEDGYRPLEVFVDGSSIGPTSIYTFFNVTAPHTIEASFTPTDSPSIVDVTDHGAIPDDAEDDSAAINSAIASASWGDAVLLPAGTYLITDSILPKSGTNLMGEGQDQTIIQDIGAQPHALILIDGATNVEISGMTLDGNDNPIAEQGIVAVYGSGHYFHDLTIKNFTTTSDPSGPHAILIGDVTDSLFENNHIQNIGPNDAWGGGIRLWINSSRNRVLNNSISNTGRGGIFCQENSYGIVIQGNTISGSGGIGLGIELNGGCDNALVEDNVVDHWISLDSSNNCAIRRNTVSDRSGIHKLAGVELAGGSNCVITNNQVNQGSHLGISVSGDVPNDYVYWGFNNINNASTWGVQLQGDAGGAEHHYFYQNDFSHIRADHPQALYPDSGYGFRFNGNAHHIVLDNNSIQDNGRDAIQIQASVNIDQLSFVNNTITGNSGSSIDLDPAAVDLEWSNNTVQDNGVNLQLNSRGFDNEKPIASFSPPVNVSDNTYQFNSTSFDPDGSVAHVLWDFDDGLPATIRNPSHRFAAPDRYLVSLVVWDNEGRAARTEQWLDVSGSGRISLKTGFNLMGYPAEVPAEHSTCPHLLAAIGSASEIISIARYNTLTQRFEYCDAQGGVDFPIIAGAGYVVRMTKKKELTFSGDANCPSVSIATGVNMVSHPKPLNNLGCLEWLNVFGNDLVNSIQRFNTDTGRLETCAFFDDDNGGNPSAAGDDFPIIPGEGYLVHGRDSRTLELPGCTN